MDHIEEKMTLEDLKKHLGDRKWRLNNLYFIRDEDGNKVLFKMNEVQEYLHDNLWYNNIVPKARQLGVTTFFCILYLDQCLFSENKTACIIAHRQEDMKKIFKNKIKFAWDSLHPWLKETMGEPDTQTAYELTFSNGSSISVSMTTRSGTVQFLHITEHGYICQKFPEKAEEIKTGSLNSVHVGNMVSIESTAAGKEGDFYDFSMEAEKLRLEGRNLTTMDYKIFFFPWHIDKRYFLEGDFPISKEMTDYFNGLESRHKIRLSDSQKRWYQKKRDRLKDKMFAEYPSTLDEAFAVSLEGAYYSKEMARVYLTNRITTVAHDPKLEVDTWWDFGLNDLNVMLFTQSKGNQLRFIDLYFNHGEKLEHYYDILKRKRDDLGYRYRNHNLPHDADTKELQTNLSRKSALFNLGMRNIRVAPKTDINVGIDRVRSIFPNFIFDEVNCKPLYEALSNYRKDFDRKLGVWKNSPRHETNSHFADTVRGIGLMWKPDEFSELNMPESKQDTNQSFFG